MSNVNQFILKCALVICFSFSATAAEEAQTWFYELQAGELLIDVCEEHINFSTHVCLKKMTAYNQLSSDNPKPGTTFLIPVAWLREVKVGVSVLESFGEVYFKNAPTDEWQVLEDKNKFFVDEQLKTKQGNLVLRFHDGSEMTVGEDTEIVFSELELAGEGTGKIRVLLNQGRVQSIVKKRKQDDFQINTPAGVAAVRGTNFRVRLEQGKTMFNEVLAGEVAVSQDTAQTLVEQDFGIKSDKDAGLSEKRRLLEPPHIIDPKYSVKDNKLFRLEWDAIDTAQAYRYELFKGSELILSNITNKRRLSFFALNSGDYRVHLRAIDSEGLAGKNATIAFTAH